MATILIADDDAFTRMRCAKLMTKSGHEVLEAVNGQEAVEKFRTHKPDCVLMDITMPEMDGLEALTEIRQIDPNARVAMVTAMSQQEIVIQALQAGAKDYVVKPFQSERVLRAVKKLLR